MVTLTDTDEIARLSTQSLTLWISDDNANFTSVENFKLLHQGTQWYLYGFEATGQYVKVHYTHFDFANTSFTGVLSEMITADYEEHFGISGAVEETALMIANNADYAWQDQAVVLPDITGHAGTRVYLNGELLYHFVENGKVIARIPDLAAGASEELTVVTGSEDSMDISNKDAVYEVSYGTVETHRYVGGRQILSLSKGMKFPDGSVLEQDTLFAMYGNNFRVSYDGGYVWSDYAATVANPGIDTYTGTTGTAVPGDWYHGDGGWIVDWQTGRLIYQCHYLQGGYNASNILESNIRQRFIYSDDGGKTWNKGYEMPRIPEVDPQSSYCHSYSDGVMVQSYDGFGPNVDFVFDLGCQYDNNGAFCARVAYSCDAGQTWTYSTSLITFGEAAGVEGGLSECGIIERDDGVLVLYARCQFVEAIRLAKAYSYDHGITWTKAVESNIYSPNTQPILMRTDMDLDGTRETPMIFWSGNNALGGGSYRRGPVTAAKFTEDLENITDITNLFFGTPLETYTQEASCIATNPCVQQVGEDLVVTISRLNHGDSVNLIVEDFLNKFNRNKGAYDSFEGGNAEYEGWETSMGAVSVTDAAATDGSLSMVVEGGAKAVRSIPYMTDGTLSMDLYLTGSERFTLELQNAYTDKCNVTAPVGFSVAGGQLTPYGTGASIALQSGWNTVCFDVALIDGTAKLTVNGSTVTIPVNTAVEKYLCYIALNTENTVLVDNVLVQEDSAVTFSEEPETLEIAGTTMTLGNDLSLNFLIEVADVTGSGLYAEIVHGDKVFTIPQSEWVTSGNYIRIAYTGLAAKQMTDDVVITICDANGNKLASKTDSVRAYAMRMFGKSGDDFDTVLADMLNYGAAAQLQFNYKSDDLANSLMTEEQQAKATASIELANIRETAAGYQGTTLGLENNIVLNFFYSADFVGKTATVSYTDHYGVVHEYDVEVAASGNMGKVSVDELVISDCSIAITVTIDGQSVVDSVESYCARMTTLALGEPLMKFAASARTYFSK